MTADLFTVMKFSALALAALALLVFLTGCTTGLAAKLNKMPDGQFSNATLSETGKFTKTTITLNGVTKDNGVMTAKKISVSHVNPWVIDFTFTAEDYTAQLSAAAKKKVLPPLGPKSTESVPPAASTGEAPKL
jgi:ABC-type glycerol-3-phosphate transport system substrate-binding protein